MGFCKIKGENFEDLNRIYVIRELMVLQAGNAINKNRNPYKVNVIYLSLYLILSIFCH